MIKEVNYDWPNKFATMKIDTSSKLKNFIRFDWTQSAIDKKLEFNDNVEAMINRLCGVQMEYNKLVKEYKDYYAKYTTTMSYLKKKEKDVTSLHSKMVDVQTRYSEMKNKVDEVKKSLRSIPVYKEDMEILDSNTGTIYRDIKNIKEKIDCLHISIAQYNQEINGLKSKISELDFSIRIIHDEYQGTNAYKATGKFPKKYYDKQNEVFSYREILQKKRDNIGSNLKKIIRNYWRDTRL